MYETIKTEQDGATFILTLHRPQKRNIINKQMRAEVVDALMKVRADASVRAIIVWGGPEVFAAGADLSEMRGRTPMQQFRPFNSLRQRASDHCVGGTRGLRRWGRPQRDARTHAHAAVSPLQ